MHPKSQRSPFERLNQSTTTLDTYRHVLPDMEDKATEELETQLDD